MFKHPAARAFSFGFPSMPASQTSLFAITVGLGLFDPKSLSEPSDLISIANKVITESTDEMIKASSKTNKDYLIEYLERAFPEYEKINESIKVQLAC